MLDLYLTTNVLPQALGDAFLSGLLHFRGDVILPTCSQHDRRAGSEDGEVAQDSVEAVWVLLVVAVPHHKIDSAAQLKHLVQVEKLCGVVVMQYAARELGEGECAMEVLDDLLALRGPHHLKLKVRHRLHRYVSLLEKLERQALLSGRYIEDVGKTFEAQHLHVLEVPDSVGDATDLDVVADVE